MFSIFLVLSLLINACYGQIELGRNDLQDPAEWTQPRGDDEDEDIPFTSQDFNRHTPEMLKLRQNYVQALWEQILQLQRDLPSDDPRVQNTMPWLWKALRDKFNQGGLPNFDFDAVFPRPAVPMPPEVNLKTVMEILRDMHQQSMSPGPDFFENINRNLHAFNVYYDNRRKFLEDEAGKLLRFLYTKNKGCFREPWELARRFEQPLQNAYQGYSFSTGEMQSLMFNIKNIFEGFSQLKGNLGVLDQIGRRILSILYERTQDPRKDQLFHVIKKLFNKYGSVLNEPGNLKGSWPSLVVDLLAAICKTPKDLVNFISNLGGMFDANDPPQILSNEIDSVEENEVSQDNEQSAVPQLVKKRNASAKIRRKAPQIGESIQKQDQESDFSSEQKAKKAQKKYQSSSSAIVAQNFDPKRVLENGRKLGSKFSQTRGWPYGIANLLRMASLDGTDSEESESASENYQKSNKKSASEEGSRVQKTALEFEPESAQQKMVSQASEAHSENYKKSKRKADSSASSGAFLDGPQQGNFAKEVAAQSSSESEMVQKSQKKSASATSAIQQVVGRSGFSQAQQFAAESPGAALGVFNEEAKVSNNLIGMQQNMLDMGQAADNSVMAMEQNMMDVGQEVDNEISQSADRILDEAQRRLMSGITGIASGIPGILSKTQTFSQQTTPSESFEKSIEDSASFRRKGALSQLPNAQGYMTSPLNFIKAGIGGIKKNLGGLMDSSDEPTPDISEGEEILTPISFKSSLNQPKDRIKGFKRKFGSEESTSSSTMKKKGKRKSSKQRTNKMAFRRMMNARQQLEAERSKFLGKSSSNSSFQNNLALANGNPVAGSGQGVVAASSGFEGQTDTVAAERSDIRMRLAQRERLQALQAQREAEKSEVNEDIEKKTNKSTSKKSGEEEGYEKEFEGTLTPYGLSKGKMSGFKKSTSSETSESSSTFNKKSNKKASKVNEKISSLNKEIEQLQEMLASKQSVAATSEKVRGHSDAVTTMSGDVEDPYTGYRFILAQKVKQRDQLLQLRKKLASATASGSPKFRSALSRPLTMNDKSRNYQRRYNPENTNEEPNLRSPAYPVGREQLPSLSPRLSYRPLPYAGSVPPVEDERNFQTEADQGAPAFQTQGKFGTLGENIPYPPQDVSSDPQFVPQNVQSENDNEQDASEQEGRAPNYKQPFSPPRSSFRSASGSSKGYHRKFGNEENESASKTKIRQKKKKNKKAQKIAGTRSHAEYAADQQSSQQKLAAKAAKNQAYENKAKGQALVTGNEGVTAHNQEASSKGLKSESSELQAEKRNLKQTVNAKSVVESAQAEASAEDDEAETEIEKSTSSKSSKNYGEESAYSHGYDDLASFKSAKGQHSPFKAYRRQFGSADNQVSAYQNIGGRVKGGELANHLEGYRGNVYDPRSLEILRQKKNQWLGQVPNNRPPNNLVPYGFRPQSVFYPQEQSQQQGQSQKLDYQLPDQSKSFTGQQKPEITLPEYQGQFQATQQGFNRDNLPAAAVASTGGTFAQAGAYQRAIPGGNGEESGVQNRFGKFGTFHSAFSSPFGKMGKSKGYKKKFGSETSEESSKVRKKNRKKSSKQAAKLAAARAEASSSADLSSSHESLLQKQAKNAGFQNKLKGQGLGGNGPFSPVDAQSSGFEQEEGMFAASKDKQSIKLQQQARQEAIQSEVASEDEESDTDIEESTSKKTSKNFGEESGYESSYGDLSLADFAEFHSARSKPTGRHYRGYNEKNVYLDDLEKFQNARLLPPKNSKLPHNPYYRVGPPSVGPPSVGPPSVGSQSVGPPSVGSQSVGPSGEISVYRKKYGSESEEQSSKLLKKERHRVATQMAKQAAARGEMDSRNEVDQSSDQELGQKQNINTYQNKMGGTHLQGESAGMRNRYGMYGKRRDALKSRHRQRAKMYGVQKEVAAKTTESEQELEKSTREKKHKEGGEESGYNQKFNVPEAYGLHPGLRGQAKGHAKNFSKESSEKTSNLKKKSKKKTATLISKITEVQREIDMLSELQVTREHQVAASGELMAYSGKSNGQDGGGYRSQTAISAELKEIVKQKKRLRRKMAMLSKRLAIHKSESSKELEYGSSEKNSKQTGQETSYDNQYGSGNIADGNGVTGSSSGYSTSTSSQSSQNSRFGKLKALQQTNNIGMDVEAFKGENDIQLENERQNLQRFNQVGQSEGAGLPGPGFSNFGPPRGFGHFSMPAFPQENPAGQPYGDPNVNENSPFKNPFIPLANFHSPRSRKRIGKRGYKKMAKQPKDKFEKVHKNMFSFPFGKQNPFLGTGFSSPLDFGLREMNDMHKMLNRVPEMSEMPAMPEMPFRPFNKNKRKKSKKNKKPSKRAQASKAFSPSRPFNSIFGNMNGLNPNPRDVVSAKVESADMDGIISGIHKEFDLDNGGTDSNNMENNRIIGGFQKQLAVGDNDFLANNMKYAGLNSVSQSPFSKEVSQELSSQSQGVSANAMGFSEKKVSSISKVFTG